MASDVIDFALGRCRAGEGRGRGRKPGGPTLVARLPFCFEAERFVVAACRSGKGRGQRIGPGKPALVARLPFCFEAEFVEPGPGHLKAMDKRALVRAVDLGPGWLQAPAGPSASAAGSSDPQWWGGVP